MQRERRTTTCGTGILPSNNNFDTRRKATEDSGRPFDGRSANTMEKKELESWTLDERRRRFHSKSMLEAKYRLHKVKGPVLENENENVNKTNENTRSGGARKEVAATFKQEIGDVA